MTYLLALDQGTTSSRALLFDRAGKIVNKAQREFTQYFPKAGWVEHDALEIWQSQLAVARDAIAPFGATKIAAIGITNQRETTVLWHKKTGRPVARAIVWQDRRTVELCQSLATYADTIYAKTGLVLDAYFCASKLAWLFHQSPNARELHQLAQAGELAFGTIDSWLLYQLTEGRIHATDVSNAARTLLWNIHTQQWDAELLRLFNIPPAILPTVYPSGHIFGETNLLDDPFAANKPSIAVTALVGDQHAALFGQTCWQAGQAKNTYGTGCFLMANTGSVATPSSQKLLTTVGWQRDGQALNYCLEGSVFMGGATIQWLRDGLKIIQSANQVEALAASVDDSDGVVLVPAFTGLGAPYWDGDARASLLGITRGTHNGHIARAALDGIAHQVTDVVLAMNHDNPRHSISELRVDGGACQNNLLMQIQADLLQIPIIRPQMIETTAAGAAYLAGLTIGFWHSSDEILALWQVDRIFTPSAGSAAMATLARERWLNAVKRTRSNF